MRERDAGFDPTSRFAWVEAPARWSRAAIPVSLGGADERASVACPRCGWLEATGTHTCENCGGSLFEAGPERAPVEYVTPLAPRVEVVASGPLARGSLAELRSELSLARTPGLDALAVPPSGDTRALAHQTRAVLRALGPLRGRALFADEPGLGKTAAAALTLREWLARSMVSRALVLAPRAAIARWGRELSLRGVPGFSLLDRRSEANELGPLVLAPWGTVDRDPEASLLTKHRWDVVIADDADSLAEPSNARHRALARCTAPYLLLVSREGLPGEGRGVEALCSLLRARDEGAPAGEAGVRARIAACAVRTRRSGHDVALAPRAIGRLDVAVEPAEAALWVAIRQGISQGASARAQWLQALRALCSGLPALRAFVEESRTTAPRARRLHGLAPMIDAVREEGLLRGLVLALRELTALVDGPVAVIGSHDAVVYEARAFLAREKGLPRTVCAGPSDLRSESGHAGASAVRACRALVHIDLPWSADALERRVARVLHAGADPSRPLPVLAVCTDEGTARWFALHADGSALGGLGPSELAFVQRSLGGEEPFAERVGRAVAAPERFDELARECSVSRAALQAPRAIEAASDAVDGA